MNFNGDDFLLQDFQSEKFKLNDFIIYTSEKKYLSLDPC